jgi:lipopolysaccharide transport system permease protein
MNKKSISEDWDILIEPTSSIFDLKLKKVWNYRDLLLLFVRRDFVAFYKQTILGPIWFFIQPVFTMFVYMFVFANLAGISTDGIPAPIFYLIGITAWTYYSESLVKTANVFRDNINVFGKVFFPRIIMPISIVISNLVKFGIQFILLILVIIYYALFKQFHFDFNFKILLLPFFVLLMSLQALGMGMLISAMTTKYRDLSLLLTFAIQLLLYATAVVFPLDSLKGKMHTIVAINPMSYIIEGIRYSIFNKGEITLFTVAYSVSITLLLLILGTIVFNKVEKNFVDTV